MKPFREVQDRWASATVTALRFGNVDGLAKLTPEAVTLANVARQAQLTARQNLDLHARTLADQTLTEGGKLVRSASHARRTLESLDAAFVRALDSAKDRMRALTAQLEAAAAPPADAGRALQSVALLTLVQQMDPAKALGEIRADPALRAAVASAPRVLSGLSQEAYAAIRREHWEQTAPDALAAMDDLSAAVDSAEKATNSAHSEARDYIDFEAAAMLEAAKVDA